MTTEKKAERLDTNVVQRVYNGRNELYPLPEGWKEDHVDPGKDPERHTSAVIEQNREVRQGMLTRLFDSLKPASDQTKAEIRQQFGDIDYETNAPLLVLNKHASDEGEETVGEKSRRVLGRF